MTKKTKGLVLRSIKYGETSIVVNIFTSLLGVQTYLVNGIRTTKSSGSKVAMYQPGALLHMEVYHNELKGLQRIKEVAWAHIYKQVLTDVVTNSVASFMVELLFKLLKQPEENSELFDFCEDAFAQLDVATPAVIANFPLYFSIHLPEFFGFKINRATPAILNADTLFLDTENGIFTNVAPEHSHYIAGENALHIAALLQIMHPDDLPQLPLNRLQRKILLEAILHYYQLHLQDFGTMKTLPVLYEVIGQ